MLTDDEIRAIWFDTSSPTIQELCTRLLSAGARVKRLEDALLGMNSHMERMQAEASSYLEPWQYATDTEQSFISTMLYLLDGPEQREAQGKARTVLQEKSK